MRLRFLPLLTYLTLVLCATAPVFAVATGDFNNDKDVNVSDAILVLRAAVGFQAPSAEETARADLSGNGQLDTADAVGILQIGVGLRPKIIIPNPFDVTAHPDASHAVSAVITAAGGGSLTTTGADGSKFTLVFPRNALLSDEKITLTPVTSIDGLPLGGGLTAAVQLEPEGLKLLKAIALNIEPATAPPLSDQVGFAYEGQGKEYHRFPLELRATPISLSILHFSGYGVGKGTDSSGVIPTAPEDQARQAIADAVKAARGQETLPDEALTAAEKALRDWYLASVAAHLSSGEADAGALDGSDSEFVSWWRTVEFLGLSDRFQTQIDAGFDSVARGLSHGIAAASAVCADQSDATQAPRVVRWAKTAAMLGLDGRGGLNFDASFDQMQKCARFELSFDSAVQVTPVETGIVKTHLHAQIPLTITVESLFALAGEGSLDYSSVEFVPTNGGCTETDPPVGLSGQMMVLGGNLDLNLKDGTGLPEIALELTPLALEERPAEQLTLSCPGGDPSPHTVTSQSWVSGFGELHRDEANLLAEPASYVILEWSAADAPLYAQRMYERNETFTDFQAMETTVLTLKHTPVK